MAVACKYSIKERVGKGKAVLAAGGCKKGRGEVRKIPEEIKVYFENKYNELKGKAETYGDLEKLIKRTAGEANYVDPEWGALLRMQLITMLHKDWGSLSVVR